MEKGTEDAAEDGPYCGGHILSIVRRFICIERGTQSAVGNLAVARGWGFAARLLLRVGTDDDRGRVCSSWMGASVEQRTLPSAVQASERAAPVGATRRDRG